MNIGLVLSGGLAKGAYQIGVLQAINNYIPLEDIKCLSGASIGTLNGYAYLTENLDGAEHMWKNICNDNPKYFVGHVLQSSLLQQNIANICNTEKSVTSTFYTALFLLNQRKIIYKDLSAVEPEQVSQYLRASVAMPIYNHPVPLGNDAFYDGAVADDIPIYPLIQHDLDYIICVYFDDACYCFENPDFDNKVIKIAFPSDGALRQSLFLTQERIEDMIQKGYQKADGIFKTVFAEGYDNLDYIHPAIKEFNRNAVPGPTRVTVDIVATKVNRVIQRLSKRKII